MVSEMLKTRWTTRPGAVETKYELYAECLFLLVGSGLDLVLCTNGWLSFPPLNHNIV